jgi:two-component system, chemotaxis family, protein-glutamate methylesterase/glutaminase
MLRVLVVDDSEVARRLLAEVLGRDGGLQVVGEASGGAEALRLAARLRPDVITMDVQMPGMDGLETTRRIMEQHPAPIVVVSGGHDPGDLAHSVRALDAGALTALRKPRGPADPGFAAEAAELVATVKLMAEVKVFRRRPAAAAPAAGPLSGPPPGGALPARRYQAEMVAVGASTGGPAALAAILRALPATTPVPILVVQHITPGFDAALATWLDETTPLRVRLAADGQPLRPGEVVIAPAGTHLGLSGGARVELGQGPPVDGHRPSATRLFASVARVFGPRALGVILTGMGGDGAAGLLELRRAGGTALAQDEASCVVAGMPGAAVAAGASTRWSRSASWPPGSPPPGPRPASIAGPWTSSRSTCCGPSRTATSASSACGSPTCSGS